MLLKNNATELEIIPLRFERIFLYHLSTESKSFYMQAEEGQTGFPFREAHDNWINFELALRQGDKPEFRTQVDGALTPGEAYELYEWLRDVSLGRKPKYPGLAFTEPYFQHVSLLSSTARTVALHFEFWLGPPWDHIELELSRAQLHRAAETFKDELLAMFRKYGFPLDLIGL